MRRLFASLAAVAVFGTPAVACINDSELPGHEREFRSSYQADRKPGEQSPPTLLQQYGPGTMAIAGGVLLLGAGLVVARRVTARG
jgi:hypothetical protein